jgi:hypothetical protein
LTEGRSGTSGVFALDASSVETLKATSDLE